MYSTKEKLGHFQQLLAQDASDADLQLLLEKAPANSNLTRYTLSPVKNAEDILFDLLDVCTHDEIVRNRRDRIKKPSAKRATTPKKAAAKGKAGKKENPKKGKVQKKSSEAPADGTKDTPSCELPTSDELQKPASDSAAEDDSEKKSE